MDSPANQSGPTYFIVIGASAGGLNALKEIVSQLPPDIDASVFIVLHLSRKGISDYLAHSLQLSTLLPCVVAEDATPIEKGVVYVAPPNFHLLIKAGNCILGRGPEENRWRPSIDVLFRSAAVAYGTRVIGVVLSGMLDDGTAGMNAIRACGGTSIVQDPNEAEYPDMPLAVLNNMQVDHCTSLGEMGNLLTTLTNQKPADPVPVPLELRTESEISERVMVGISSVSKIGEQSIFNCPDCGGGLWRIKDKKSEHYRCHIGHAYSERDLLTKQAEMVESSLWVAVRIMEERKNLIRKIESDVANKGFKRIASDHSDRAEELEGHIEQLKKLIFVTQNTDHT